MLFRRSMLAACGALTLLPAAASAATAPAIAGPTPESLAASRPNFSWTPGPGGERVSSITISKTSTVGADGTLTSTSGGAFLWPLKALTSTTSERALYSGAYFWNAKWETADGVAPFETGATPVQAFVIPGYVRGMRGSFTQYGSIPSFSVKGSMVTNAKRVAVLCRVWSGRRIVSQRRKVVTWAPVGARANFSCGSLSVPERLDGRRLKLQVIARGGGQRSVAVRWFRAI